MPQWLLEVTDLKQYMCCPRIVFYRYCLPKIRPITYLMEEGIHHHLEEDGREERRSLRSYGLVDGERFFHLTIQSERLGLTGRVDLAIAVPTREAANAEAVVVEYKLSEQKAGQHFVLQLAAYAMLVEEAWGLPVKRAFLYSIPLRRAEPVPVTAHLRKKVVQTVAQIRHIVESEIMPPPPPSQRRCVTCEFRRFCNDVV
ncbi:MAG: CRISPR-associated protein Cas4 [Ktedonobacteraceae bacterium]